MKLQQGAPSALEPAFISGTNDWWELIVRRDQGVSAQALCRSGRTTGLGFVETVQSFPPLREEESGSRWSLRHTVEEPPGQLMKMKVPWPLQRVQHKAAKVCRVVLVAAMALASQLSLVTPSVKKSLLAPATWLIPETPALPDSQVVQPLPFRRSRGHLTFQGLVELLHPEPEF